MQELKDEMNRRIKTLESHIEHSQGERENLLQQIAGYEQQITDDQKLAKQYREALRRLDVSVTYQSYDEIVAAGQGRPDAL
jgi:hypothetical protein